METLTRKVDELTALVRASAAMSPADMQRLRWWAIGMSAVVAAALVVAVAATAVMFSTNG